MMMPGSKSSTLARVAWLPSFSSGSIRLVAPGTSSSRRCSSRFSCTASLPASTVTGSRRLGSAARAVVATSRQHDKQRLVIPPPPTEKRTDWSGQVEHGLGQHHNQHHMDEHTVVGNLEAPGVHTPANRGPDGGNEMYQDAQREHDLHG